MMNYSRLIVLALALSCLGPRAYGAVTAAGFFGTFVEVDANGTTALYEAMPYSTTPSELGGRGVASLSPSSFNGANLGTFTPSDSLTFSAVQALMFHTAFASAGGALAGDPVIHYRVTPSGGTSGADNTSTATFKSQFNGFTAINGASGTVASGTVASDPLGAQESAFGHPLAISPTSPNFVSGLVPGSYDLEVYFSAEVFNPTGVGANIPFYDNSSDSSVVSNYTASFTVTSVPEPAVALLVGLGGLVLTGFRRKREAE